MVVDCSEIPEWEKSRQLLTSAKKFWILTEMFANVLTGRTAPDCRIACFPAQSTHSVCSCSQGTHIIITFVAMAMVIMIPYALMRGKYTFHFHKAWCLGYTVCQLSLSIAQPVILLTKWAISEINHYPGCLYQFIVAACDKHRRSHKQGLFSWRGWKNKH